MRPSNADFSKLPVLLSLQVKEGAWEGVRRKYWHFDQYYLPICKLVGGPGKKEEGGEAGEPSKKKQKAC